MWDKLLQKLSDNMAEIWQSIAGWLDQHLFNIIVIFVGVSILRRVLTKAVSRIIRHTTMRHDLFPTETDRKKRIKTLDSLIGTVVRTGLWIVAAMMIVSELGINTAPLLASAGIVGVALGFGAQSLIKDFTSGIFIIVENQYRVGDVISVGGISGEVEAITIRTTVLRDLDGQVHHVPNGTIAVTTNMTMNYARVNEDITVGRDTNLEELEHIITHVGQQMLASSEFKNAIIEAPFMDRVVSFSRDGIVVKILAKTVAGDQWRTSGELYKRLKIAFDKHGIELPYSQFTLHEAKKKRS